MQINEFIEKVVAKGKQALQFLKNLILFIFGSIAYLPIFIKRIWKKLIKIGQKLWENINKSFYSALGGLVAIIAISIALFALFLVLKICKPNFNNFITSSYILPTSQEKIIDAKTETSLNYLIAKGKIVSAEDVYGHILNYYDTLISFLIGILGVFGIVSWVSLQAKAKHEAEKCVEDKISENSDFKYRLDTLIKKAVTDVFSQEREDLTDELKEYLFDQITTEGGQLEQAINKALEKEGTEITENLEGLENGNEV